MNKEAGIYIHIPFCEKKCLYCAFYSVAMPDLYSPFIDALLNELTIRANSESWCDFSFKTLYIGGGTPSILSIGDLEKIFKHLGQILDLSKLEEITLELNPEHRLKIPDIKKHTPINRLSIGIQSFDNKRLEWMNRRHNLSESIQAIELAQNNGIGNISIDLIYGLPEMNIDEWEKQLSYIKKLDIPHFSAYALTPEPQTLLTKQIEKGLVSLPSEDILFEQYDYTVKWGFLNGFEAYEVSSWAKDGKYSQHNSLYWDAQTPYLGVGPGAHSFKFPYRRANSPDLKKYIATPYDTCHYYQETIDQQTLFREYIMTALRTCWGIEKKRLDLFPPKLQMEFVQKIKPFILDGSITETPKSYIPNPYTRYKADGIALLFF